MQKHPAKKLSVRTKYFQVFFN